MRRTEASEDGGKRFRRAAVMEKREGAERVVEGGIQNKELQERPSSPRMRCGCVSSARFGWREDLSKEQEQQERAQSRRSAEREAGGSAG